MTDFGGDFDVPPSILVPGSWVVGGWTDAVVTINKMPVSLLQSFDCSRDLNIGAGTCNIRLSDPDKLQYNLFQAGDEVEIFFSLQTEPPVGRKVWGGFIDNLSFDINDGQTLKLSGKEYISRLQSQLYDASIATTPISTAIRTIMASQGDFTYEGVVSMPYQIAVNAKNDTIYNVLKQICDQNHVYFWINPEVKDMETREATTISNSPDLIYEGVNLLQSGMVKKNSEYLINSAVVNYAGNSTPATASNATSQAAYGVFGRAVSVGNMTDAVAAGTFGTTLVTNRGAPVDAYEIESLFLPYTDPGEYLEVVSPTLELNAAYQVLNIKHAWSKSTGIKTTVQLNTQLATPALYVADLERRLRLAEKYAFSSIQA